MLHRTRTTNLSVD